MGDRQQQQFLMKQQLLLRRCYGNQKNGTAVALCIQLFEHASDGDQTGVAGDKDDLTIERWRKHEIPKRP
jgi:hypothetical protein